MALPLTGETATIEVVGELISTLYRNHPQPDGTLWRR
jgi:hypothetical protein